MAKVTYLDKGISAMQPMVDATNATASNDVGVVLQEEKCLGYINVRLAESADFGLVKSVLSEKVSVLTLSPTEWLLITPAGEEIDLVNQLNDKLSGEHHLVADVTGGTTKLNITGKHAQDILEKGTYVDLCDSVFGKGHLYATQIAHAPAIIIKNGSNDFSLIVRRSFSHHIANWAVDAAAEYGFSFS